jgi:hypothetical protein
VVELGASAGIAAQEALERNMLDQSESVAEWWGGTQEVVGGCLGGGGVS